jgi:HEPN domain-containing protein
MEPLTGAERAARYRRRKAGKLVTPSPRSVQAADTRHAMACFEKAIQFRNAAHKLLQVMKSPDNLLPFRDPTYFLYHHATELALKACLLSHGLSRRGHNIGALFELCRANKFLGLNDVHFELHNVIVLLGGGNRWERYRYAGVNNNVTPDLPWVHEAVAQLFEAVKPQVIAWATNNSALPAPSTNWLSFGKPSYVKQPVPSKPGP